MSQSNQWAGRVALITGASRGIGQATLAELGRLGATVIGTATGPEGAAAIAERIQTAGYVGEGFEYNASVPGSAEALLAKITTAYGAPSILVNNAGMTRDNLSLRMSDEEWDSVIEVNLTAVFKITKAVLRGMMKARWGRIIHMSSVVALNGNPGQSNYCAAKAGLNGMMRALSKEVAKKGVTVNSIAPGFIETDMTRALSEELQAKIKAQIPMGEIGTPEDIAYLAAFLASDEARYITGQTLSVNGGMY